MYSSAAGSSSVWRSLDLTVGPSVPGTEEPLPAGRPRVNRLGCIQRRDVVGHRAGSVSVPHLDQRRTFVAPQSERLPEALDASRVEHVGLGTTRADDVDHVAAVAAALLGFAGGVRMGVREQSNGHGAEGIEPSRSAVGVGGTL